MRACSPGRLIAFAGLAVGMVAYAAPMPTPAAGAPSNDATTPDAGTAASPTTAPPPKGTSANPRRPARGAATDPGHAEVERLNEEQLQKARGATSGGAPDTGAMPSSQPNPTGNPVG